jgi:hypothetical protein
MATNLNLMDQTLAAAEAPVKVLNVELLDSSGQVANSFSYADDVQVRVTYQAQEPVRSPSLLACIVRSDGMTCCEVRTRNDEVWLPDLEDRGQFTFSIEPLQLASGAYMIEIRLRDTADAAPLGDGQSDWFHVSGPGVTVLYEYGGVYVPRVRWNFAAGRRPAKRGAPFPYAESGH